MQEELKFDLCCAARSLFRQGLSVSIAGHISVKVGPEAMLVNRFGPSFGTLTPDDILLVDFDGKILEGIGWVNDTIRLHGVVHRMNPQHVAVAHTHPPGVVTWSALRQLPQVYDQEGCFLAGEVAIVEEDYEGLAATEDRVLPVGEALRTHAAVILPNHGAITAGPSIPVALLRMILLEQTAQRNLAVAAAARNTGLTPRPISPEAALRAKQELANLPAIEPIWADILAQLKRTDPELFAAREQSSACAS